MADKDLDFDEIDMAVNDHMGLSDSRNNAEEKHGNDDTRADEGFDSEVEHNNVDEETIDPMDGEEAKNTSSHLIHSRSTPMTKPPVPHPQVGRFMDVMHPSSLMKKKAPSHNRKKNKKEAETDPDHLIEAGDMPPLLTPFLPDANEKVEKRPLGWSPPEPTSQTLAEGANETPSSLDHEATKKQDLLHPDDSKTPVIHESNLPSDQEQSETTKKSEPDPQLLTDPSEVPTEEETEEMKLLKIESREVSESSMYDYEPNSTTSGVDSASGVSGAEESNSQKNTIFDVNEYHQPLQHPVKQKSGWPTVVIIVVIIALCAGMAALAYFFFSSNL